MTNDDLIFINGSLQYMGGRDCHLQRCCQKAVDFVHDRSLIDVDKAWNFKHFQ